MTPEVPREGWIRFSVGRACRGQAMEAATTPGRSEPCFAGRTSCFGFSRMADLPTEQEFMQGQDTRASRSTEGSALAKGLTQMKHDVSVIPAVVCCDSKVVQCFAVHCLRDAGVEECLSDRSELQDGTGREVLGSKQWTVRSSDRPSARCMCGCAVVLMRSDRCELRGQLSP